MNPVSRVLLCTGLGLPASSWDPVAELLSTQSICIDRVQVQSSYLDRPLRLEAEVERLHELVGDAPMTVVGHSFGGLFVEGLARRHPELVTGMVLVDSSVEIGPLAPGERVLHLMARRVPSMLPKPRRIRALAWELEAYLPVAVELQRWREQRTLPDVPIEILTAVVNRAASVDWVNEQRALADLFAAEPPERHSVVRQVNVRGTHQLMSSAPDEVAASIERVLALAAGAD